MTYTEEQRKKKHEYYMKNKLKINERTNNYWDKHKKEINAKRNEKNRLKRLKTKPL